MMRERTAVLFDFGGVLTTSVLAGFRDFGAAIGADAKLPLDLLANDRRANAALIAHEEGRTGQREFEDVFAERLRAHGVDVQGEGLLERLQSRLYPDKEMIELVADVRAKGYRVGLLSNSLGDDAYAGYDLESMFDAVTISAEIGVRKPSRRAYEIACARLGALPRQTVMIDDLRHNLAAAEHLGFATILHRDGTNTAITLWTTLTPLPAGTHPI